MESIGGSDRCPRSFARRIEMVKQMTQEGLDAVRAAAAHGVTAPTARKWLGRYLACTSAFSGLQTHTTEWDATLDRRQYAEVADS